MMKRFSRQVSDAANSFTTDCGRGDGCKCCAAARRARDLALFDPLPEWNSPLTAGIQIANISHSEDGTNLHVDLSSDWTRMFDQLSSFGPALVMTRNAGAIIGRRMTYPELLMTSGGGKAANCEGGLFLEFRDLGIARAVHLRRQIGHVFGVEFSDNSDKIIHRITLTPESDMDEFFGWVRLHQACTAHRATPPLDEGTPPRNRDRALLWRQCDTDALTSIVAACVDRTVPLRATVRSSAVTQRAQIMPLSLQPSDDWWFLSDDESGLHFQPEIFTAITLEKHLGEGGERAVLRAAMEAGASAFLLEAADPDAEDAWREVLRTVA